MGHTAAVAEGPRDVAPAGAFLTDDVDRAVRALLDGGLVGLPTETVYGLAADADSPRAVARVYAAKGRPADHPLIVHLARAEHLGAWSTGLPAYAERFAEALWPGPLTLVVPRGPRAGHHVTGGQETVGLRVPVHPVARAVLEAFAAAPGPGSGARGAAAPSANRFGRVSPTTPRHVLDELAAVLTPGLDVVLDGGASAVGIESTIVDCTGPEPVVLRPGVVTDEELVRVGGVALGRRTGSVRAPGMLASHYAPRARVVLRRTHHDRPPRPGSLLAEGAPTAGPPAGLLALAEVPTPPGVVRLSAPADPAAYARVLYAALREADALGLHTVVAVPPAGPGIAAAVRDRLGRAATGTDQDDAGTDRGRRGDGAGTDRT